MSCDEERPMMEQAEMAVALAELELAGLIEYKEGSDEDIIFTDKGFDFAWDLWDKLSPKERLAMWLLSGLITGAAEIENES